MQLARCVARAQAVALALLFPAMAQAGSYTFNYINIMTDWQYRSGGMISAINSSNQVTGHVSFGPEMPETSFLHQNHRTTFLGTQLTNINDINNAGVMAGTMHGTVAATLANGQTTLLLNDDRYSAATAINNHGVAVGWATNRGLFTYRAMMYSNGTATDLGTLGGREAFATDINDAGVIVGRSRLSETSFDTHAFIYQDGVMTDLGAPAGAANSTALTITEDGTVLVSGQLPNGSNKSYLYRDGATTDLSGIFTRAVVDMNNAGTILGQSNEGFLVYDKLGQAHDLSLEVAQTTGGTLAQVFAIGDNGTVGAEICHGISCTMALMIPSPVPEPETGGMLLAGLGLVGWLGRRRR